MSSRVRPIFRRLRALARERFPDFDVTLRMGDPAEFPELRAHAYCEDTAPPRITYAPKLEIAHRDRIEGILRHEIGHALAFAARFPDHTERDTDEIARLMFGDVIRYDADDVQTVGAGVTPRPRRLGL